MNLDTPIYSRNDKIDLDAYQLSGFKLYLKREDLIHPHVSGNKFRKLKYNLKQAQSEGASTILTVGGAYSNHIAATAAAANLSNINSIGIIRGKELATMERNNTLVFAESQGMQLHFVPRSLYKGGDVHAMLDYLGLNANEYYIVPEGGSNSLAVKGCAEILGQEDALFDYICVSVGTGGTMAGIVKSANKHQKVLGFSALKGNFLKEVVENLSGTSNFKITDEYSMGGYGKIDEHFVRFLNEFKHQQGISLDPIYTGKMMFGIIGLMKKGYFQKNSRILAIHTGGLQAISGMNKVLKSKGLPQID